MEWLNCVIAGVRAVEPSAGPLPFRQLMNRAVKEQSFQLKNGTHPGSSG